MTGKNKLFPGTLAVTDPELIEVFDNFAFGETVARSGLDTRRRLVVQLGALIAAQSLGQYRSALGAALADGLTPVEIKEIVYQSVPYVGMAKAVDFLHETNDVLTEHGVELPLPGQSTTTPETRAADGVAVQKQIVGSAGVDRLYASAPDDEQHIQRYLSANCFGDYYTRSGLDLRTRELLTLSILVALGGADGQVRGHVMGNLNVGNDRSVILDVLTVLLPYVGYPRTLNALRMLDDAAPADADATAQPSSSAAKSEQA
ncbi:carboxymuconolactone decarboxylase family protein [Rhodococcus globerulus]|uniref:carboxymuconolactone decarboxylase family protein n=1 Tax=Rhodococcus globerulus TaxID=33008 RepID=UPI000B300B96|nr:carboxymuconolactone decarboxylase family protein [Rhodococcus globerulus]